MAQDATIRVTQLREFIRAADAAGKETKRLVRDRLREVARPVLESARTKLSTYDATSAAGLGISVRRTGIVAVEQRRKKTTGQHPEFGRLQMREALVPALNEQDDRILREFEKAVDDIINVFERG